MSFYNADATPSNNTSFAGIDIQGTANVRNFDNFSRAIAAAARQFVADLAGANTVGGTADAITITLASGSLTGSVFDGMPVGFEAASDNTSTTVTANVAGKGAEPVKKSIDGAETTLAVGDIKAGNVYMLRWRADWDSSNGAWELTNRTFRSQQASQFATGTYTGDNATSQAITGVGFQPKAVWIIEGGADGDNSNVHMTTDTLVDDDADGLAYTIAAGSGGDNTLEDNAIISLDSDGFTVDDSSGNNHPNKSGETYHYFAWG